MGRKPKSRPSFFKVIAKDFTPRLQLPPVFVQKYGEILHENAKLRTSSGEIWNVELEQMEEEKFCFTRGWTKFAADVGLKLGEFLVFWLNDGKSTFDVSVYGINGCERQILARNSPVKGCSDSDEDVESSKDCALTNHINALEIKNNQSGLCTVDNGAGSDGAEEVHPHFKVRLTEHQRSRVLVRKDFAVAVGLMSQEAVVLQLPPSQRCWPVLLAHGPDSSWFRLEMRRGWSEFRKRNGLVFGKTYLFEYIQDKNVIEVKMLNEEN